MGYYLKDNLMCLIAILLMPISSLWQGDFSCDVWLTYEEVFCEKGN